MTFQDTDGDVVVKSPANLKLLNDATTYYVCALGLTTVQPSLSNYLALANEAPPAHTGIYSYLENDDETCYVY